MVYQCFLDILGATQRVGSCTRILNPPEALPLFVALVDAHVCGTAGASALRPSRDDDGSMAAARPHDADTYFYYMLSAAQRQSLGRKLMPCHVATLGAIGLGAPKALGHCREPFTQISRAARRQGVRPQGRSRRRSRLGWNCVRMRRHVCNLTPCGR